MFSITALLLLLLSSQAQQPASMNSPGVDELRQTIASLRHGKAYVDAILKLVGQMHILTYPIDSAERWLEKAEYTADQIEYMEGLRDVYRLRGISYEILSRDYQRSLYWYEESLKLSSTDGQRHQLYTSILNLNFYLGDFVNAMQIASVALKLAEEAGDKSLVAHYYNVIGFVHLRQNNATAAMQAYQQYRKLGEELNDTLIIADAITCQAETHLLNRNFEKALEYLFVANNMYLEAHRTGRLWKKDRLPYLNFKIGFTYGEQVDLKTALTYVQKTLDGTKQYSCNLYDVASYYIYAGNLYRRLNDNSRSLQMLRQGLSLAKSIDHKENIRDASLNLHQLFALMGRFDSAYQYYRTYDQLKDSISNEKTRREIRQIEASYKVEKKDQEIEILKQKQALAEAKSKRNVLYRNLIIIFFVLVIVTIAFVLNRRELRRKNEAQKEINERQNEIFNIISSTQDQERKRIAQDLHDGLGTLLSAAKLKLSSAQPDAGPVNDAIRMLDEAVVELRNISHNIMPATLSRIGLIGALQNFFGRLKNPGINFELVHDGFDGRIEEEKEIILYRCILELVNNAVKHSGADHITIQLVKHPEQVNVIVEDNGKGMQQDNEREEGIGLKSISSRIRYLGGSFAMDSGSQGTTAIIDIPV